ncbi:MAG: hypothetical protein ACJATO_000643, partial [Arenicella sp.]
MVSSQNSIKGDYQMKKMTKVAVFIATSLAASNALAADWSVTQDVTITVAAPSFEQGATGNVVSSNQALNGIVLEASDSLAVGTQTANITSSTGIILTQGNQVDGATQALNLIDAHDIGSGGIVSQTVNQLGAGTTTLTQADNAATGGNMQAANLGIASGDVIDLDQVYAEDGDLTLVQSSVASSSNIQGVNYVEAADHIGATGLDQSVTVDGTTSLTQGELNVGGLNVQVGNGAVAIAGTISKTSQAFTSAGDMGLTQSAGGIGGNNIQAVNMISAEGAGADIGDAAAVTQTVTV